jgi:hypothetical protein
VDQHMNQQVGLQQAAIVMKLPTNNHCQCTCS